LTSEKKQKDFLLGTAAAVLSADKSFLVLFFKKEPLSFVPESDLPARGNLAGHEKLQ
jgi:hypothetical protein